MLMKDHSLLFIANRMFVDTIKSTYFSIATLFVLLYTTCIMTTQETEGNRAVVLQNF